MVGVDLVIKPLFEISGVRSEGDCARVAPEVKRKMLALAKTLISFTTPIVIALTR